MPAELIEWYKKLGLNMLEAYGMTEDLGYSHMAKPDNCRAGFVGQVADMVQTRISEEGEIYIKSPGNMVGYYKQPELTAESYTEDGYFKTGDRGEYNDDGLLRITGRVKELFKTSKGKYVAPAPIENLLNSNARVELSCVSGLGRPACYAVIQLRGDLRAKAADHSFRQEVAPQLEAMLESINSQVERYEKVQFLAVVQEEWQAANNFLTPTLKIKRDVIEAAYEPFLNDWYSSEQKVIWQD